MVYRGAIANNPCQKKTIVVDGNLDDWKTIPAIDLVKNGAVEMKGHKGPDDLSGWIRIAYDDNHFYLFAAIRDDVHFQPNVEDNTWKGDGIQIAISEALPWNSTGFYEVNLALTSKGPDVFLSHSARGEKVGKVTSALCRILREGATTNYELAIPLKELALIDPAAIKAFGFSLLVNDNDGEGRKGWIEWGSGIGKGKHPDQFEVCRLEK